MTQKHNDLQFLNDEHLNMIDSQLYARIKLFIFLMYSIHTLNSSYYLAFWDIIYRIYRLSWFETYFEVEKNQKNTVLKYRTINTSHFTYIRISRCIPRDEKIDVKRDTLNESCYDFANTHQTKRTWTYRSMIDATCRTRQLKKTGSGAHRSDYLRRATIMDTERRFESGRMGVWMVAV